MEQKPTKERTLRESVVRRTEDERSSPLRPYKNPFPRPDLHLETRDVIDVVNPYQPCNVNKMIDTAGGRSASSWTLGAPKLSRAIQKLRATLDRAPSHSETAREMGLDLTSFYRMLNLVDDFGDGVLATLLEIEEPPTNTTWWREAPQDDQQFQCLRADLLALFRGATFRVPESETLSTELDYSRSPDRESVRLRIKVGVPGSESPVVKVHIESELRVIECGPPRRPHIETVGIQYGSLLPDPFLEAFGERASWERRVISCYRLGDKQKPFRRDEVCHLEANVSSD